MQGRWNSDLTALGRQQARQNGKLLANRGIEAMLASPIGRVRETVALIGEDVESPIRFDDRLVEWDCGDWSGYLYDEVAERWPAEWKALEADRFHYRGPGCENYPDMVERARPFLSEVLAQPETSIAIVSHGMIGRVMISTLLGWSEDETLRFFQPNDWVFRVLPASRSIEHFIAGDGPHPGPGPLAGW